MTIVFTPSGGSPVNLAGAAADGSDGPFAQSGSLSQLMQEEPVTGATKPAVHDRGNRRVTRSFSSRKEYADYEAAQAAEVAMYSAVSGLGSCVFTQGSSVLTLTDAYVQFTCVSMGATNEYNWTVTGSL